MLMDMCLPKFDIHQGTMAPNYFKSHTNYFKIFFRKNFFFLTDVWSEIHHLLALKNDLYSGLTVVL